MKLIYTGGGYGGFLPNIPARDLNDEEVKRYGEAALIASGLYVKTGDQGNGGNKGDTTAPLSEAAVGLDDDVSEAAHDEYDLKESTHGRH